MRGTLKGARCIPDGDIGGPFIIAYNSGGMLS